MVCILVAQRLARLACFLGRNGMLASIVVVPLLVAQTAARHTGEDVKTIDLLAHPESKDLANAKEAFRQGDIVRIIGGNPEDLQRLLGIGGAILTRSHSPAHASNSLNALQNLNATAPVYQVVAARATRSGASHEFLQFGTDSDLV